MTGFVRTWQSSWLGMWNIHCDFDWVLSLLQVHNFSNPVLVPPQQSRYIFSLLFRPVRSSVHIDSNILLITNASKFHLPVRAYTGFMEVGCCCTKVLLFLYSLYFLFLFLIVFNGRITMSTSSKKSLGVSQRMIDRWKCVSWYDGMKFDTNLT